MMYNIGWIVAEQRLTQSEEQFSAECRKWPVTVFSLSVLYLTILSDSIFNLPLMLSQWDTKSKKDLNDRFVIITTILSVIVVAAAVVIVAFLIFFSSVHWP